MISYIVDVYRGDVKAQPSFLRFIMYVSMYFQLVAGPIVRYSDVAWEIGHRTANANDISHGITRFCIGLLKKVAVANVAGSLLVQYMDGDLTKVTVLGSWFGAVLFMLQIYYDFSGYSDMAIGLGLMFGFHFVENFNYPYIAKTATEFWRRWHISLSSFLRDYLYIPLGGNRSHAWRNLFVVWFATGLWHGASWNFILWGLFFGVLIALERLGLRNLLEKLPGFISHFYLLFAVLISWVIFYFTDLSRAAQYLGIMFGLSGQPLTNYQTLLALEGNLFWLILAVVFCLPLARIASQQITAAAAVSRPRQIILGILVPVMNLGILLICTAMLSGQSYNPFLYYRF